MAATFCFDESEQLEAILARYHRAAVRAGLAEVEVLAGEASVRKIHLSLSESLRLGNQSHFEKLIGKDTKVLRVIAMPRRQRGIFSRLFARLSGR